MDTVASAVKLIASFKSTQTARKTMIYRDSNYGEYRVKFYDAVGYLKNADYYTSDRFDAMKTARHWIAG